MTADRSWSRSGRTDWSARGHELVKLRAKLARQASPPVSMARPLRSGRCSPPSASSVCHKRRLACMTVTPVAPIVCASACAILHGLPRHDHDRGAADAAAGKAPAPRCRSRWWSTASSRSSRRRARTCSAIEPRKLLRRAVAHHHALRRAGRARGVDHIGRVVADRGRAAARCRAGARSPTHRRRAARCGAPCGIRQPVEQRRLRHQHRRSRRRPA